MGGSKDPGRLSKSDHRNKMRTWYHSVYGVIVNKTALKLTELFPKMNLHRSGLYNVANGKCKFHKGWYILQDGEDAPKWLNYDKRVKANWVHPVHGKIFNVTAEGLVKLFPEEGYKKNSPLLPIERFKISLQGVDDPDRGE